MRPQRKPPPTVLQILAWVDAHRSLTGQWPGAASGHVLDNRNEKWVNSSQELRLGLRVGRRRRGARGEAAQVGWMTEGR
jgi:hypothetical protein